MLVNVLPLTPTHAQSEVLMQLWYPKQTTLEIIHLVSPQWLRPYVSRSLAWWIRSTVQSEKQKVSFKLGLNSVRRCCTSHTMMVIVTAWVLSSTCMASYNCSSVVFIPSAIFKPLAFYYLIKTQTVTLPCMHLNTL